MLYSSGMDNYITNNVPMLMFIVALNLAVFFLFFSFYCTICVCWLHTFVCHSVILSFTLLYGSCCLNEMN